MNSEDVSEILEENGVTGVDLYWALENSGSVGPQVLVDVIESYGMEEDITEQLACSLYNKKELLNYIDWIKRCCY